MAHLILIAPTYRYTNGRRAINERFAVVDEPVHAYHTSDRVTSIVHDACAEHLVNVAAVTLHCCSLDKTTQVR